MAVAAALHAVERVASRRFNEEGGKLEMAGGILPAEKAKLRKKKKQRKKTKEKIRNSAAKFLQPLTKKKKEKMTSVFLC